MKILLLGASGMIGSRILAEATGRGHRVVAVARTPAKITAGKGVTAVGGDLTNTAALASHAADVDVIVAAVSPRSTGDAEAEQAANGAALMALAEQSGKRLMVVGGAGSLNLPDGSPVLPHVPAEYQAEARGMKAFYGKLRDSALDWTFFAPAGMIQPGERTGSFRLGTDILISDAAGNSRISAEDFAAALVDELEQPAHRRAIMTIGY